MQFPASRRSLKTMRILMLSAASLWLAVLVGLVLFAPPDGQQRGELTQFFGNLHPLAVHLPIALLLLLPVLELVGRSPSRAYLKMAASFVLALALISALVAPALGWLLAWSGGFAGAFVTQHMWGGIAVAAGSLLCWVLRPRLATEHAPAVTPVPYAVMLAITVTIMAWTGYRGGQLAHGEQHLTEHLPAPLQAWLGVGAVEPIAPSFYTERVMPILKKHCLTCHGVNKSKGGLRLDSYAALMRGGKDGPVIRPGDVTGSDLFRRVSLEPTHEDFMPAEGKPPLEEKERALLKAWIEQGASDTLNAATVDEADTEVISGPAAPDYRADAQLLVQLQETLGVQLVPRSENPTDGLVLRTASAPSRCDDDLLARLAPVGRYIVDAELARTAVTDAGLRSLAAFTSLRTLDLSHTSITSSGLVALEKLGALETLNLTATRVDDAGVEPLRRRSTLKHLYLFETRATQH